jgi:hypothetical protein
VSTGTVRAGAAPTKGASTLEVLVAMRLEGVATPAPNPGMHLMGAMTIRLCSFVGFSPDLE